MGSLITLLFNKCNSINEIKKDGMGCGCSTNGEKNNAYKILVGKLEVKRPLGRPKSR
jgi:hypothetical protein